MLETLVYVPDIRLHKISDLVKNVNDDLINKLDNMVETMHSANGIGLSGVQIGYMRRVLVTQIKEEDPLYLMINPIITAYSDDQELYEEGCLSIPTIFVPMERPVGITVCYIDTQGQEKSLTTEGLLARCIQHEIDHLDGKIFTDFLSSLKRSQAYRQVQKHLRTSQKEKQGG